MANEISPYLRIPRRDLPTACKQIHHARGMPPPCGTCDLSDICENAPRREPQAVSALPQTVKSKKKRAIVCLFGQAKAA